MQKKLSEIWDLALTHAHKIPFKKRIQCLKCEVRHNYQSHTHKCYSQPRHATAYQPEYRLQ